MRRILCAAGVLCAVLSMGATKAPVAAEAPFTAPAVYTNEHAQLIASNTPVHPKRQLDWNTYFRGRPFSGSGIWWGINHIDLVGHKIDFAIVYVGGPPLPFGGGVRVSCFLNKSDRQLERLREMARFTSVMIKGQITTGDKDNNFDMADCTITAKVH